MKRIWLVSCLLAGSVPLGALAASLSVNFTTETGTDALVSGSSYGFVPVTALNWNQVTTVSAASAATTEVVFPEATDLVDDSGVLTAATVAVDARTLEAPIGATFDPLLRGAVIDYYNDARQNAGWPKIKLSNIPYAHYRVYVYMCNDAWPKNGSITITPDGGGESDFYYMDGPVVKTATSNTGWGDRSVTALTLGSNCLLTPVLTDPNITINVHRSNSGSFRANVSAIQIQEIITEPVTLTLTGNTVIDAADYKPGAMLIIDNTASGNTLTINGALSVASLTFKGTPLAVHLTDSLTAPAVTIENNLILSYLAKTEILPQARLALISGAITLSGSGAIALAPSFGVTELVRDTSAETGLHAYARRSLPQSGLNAISVNFGSARASLAGQSGSVGAYPVDASRWMNIAATGNSGSVPTTVVSTALTDQAGNTLPETTTLKICSRGGDYFNGSADTLIGKLMHGYLDDSNGSNYSGIILTQVPYQKYGVVVYFNTDVATANPFPSYGINGAYYRGDSTQAWTVPASNATAWWGVKSTTALTEGQNYLLVTGFNSTDHPNINVSIPVGSVGTGHRACISGFQVIDLTDVLTDAYTATVSGDTTFSEIAWDGAKPWSGGSASATASIGFADSATFTLDGAITLGSMALSTPGELLIKNASPSLRVNKWNLSDVAALILDGEADTYLPTPVSGNPGKYVYTAPSANVAINSGSVYEFRAGSAEAPAAYTAAYNGGSLQIASGTYRMVASPTATKTTLTISGEPTIHFNNGTADTNFDIGTMDVTISGGTIRALRFVTSQGYSGRPSTVNITGGDITITKVSDGSGTADVPLMFGHWPSGTSTVNLSGGSIRADGGFFRLSNDSPVNFTMSGGYLSAKGIVGSSNATTFLLSGGELALASGGFDRLGNCTFTLAGGTITATEINAIRQTVIAQAETTSIVAAAPEKATTLAIVEGSGNLVFGTETNTGTVGLSTSSPDFTGTVSFTGITFNMATGRMPAAMLSPDSSGNIALSLSAADLAASAPVPVIGWAGSELPENITFSIYESDGVTLRTDASVALDTEKGVITLRAPAVEWTAETDSESLDAYCNVTVGSGATASSLLYVSQLIVPATGGTIACEGNVSIRPVTLALDGALTLDATGMAGMAAYAAPGVPYTTCLIYAAIDDTEKVTVIPPVLPAGYESAVEIFSDGVYLTFTSPAYTTPTININFISGSGTGAKPGVNYGEIQSQTIQYGTYPVVGEYWNEVIVGLRDTSPTNEVSAFFPDSEDAPLVTVIQSGQSGGYGCATVPLDFLKGYIDEGAAYLTPTLTITGLDAAFGEGSKYRVVFYASTDTAGARFGYATIGGVDYTAKHGHTLKGVAEAWGDSRSTTPVEGDFHLISEVLTGDELVIQGHRLASNIRGTIAAIQIIQVSDVLRQVPLYQPTALATGDWANCAWVDASNNDAPYSGSWNEPGSMALIDADNASPVTLTVNQAVSLAKLTVKGSGDLAIVLGGNGSFTAGEYDFSQHTGTLSIAFATGTANVTIGSRTALEAGSGILTINPDCVATLPVLNAWSGIVINNGIIRYRGTISAETAPAQSGVIAFDDLTYTGSGIFAMPTLKMEPGDQVTLHNTQNANETRIGGNALITGGTLTLGSADSDQAAWWNGTASITQTGGSVIYEGTGTATSTSGAIGLLLGADNKGCTWNMSGGTLSSPNAPLNLWARSANAFTLSGSAQATLAGIIQNGGTVASSITVKDGASLTLGSVGVPAPAAASTFTISNATINAATQTSIGHDLTLSGAANLRAASGQELALDGFVSGPGALVAAAGTVTMNGAAEARADVQQGATLRVDGVLGAAKGRYLRLRVTNWPKAAYSGLAHVNSGVAMAEFRLLFQGEVLSWNGATLTATPNHSGGATNAEGSNSLIDGKPNTKFYASSSTTEYVTLFDRKEGALPFDSYQIFATDQNGRNPLSWVLEISNDSTNWTELDRRTLDLSDLVSWNWAGATATEPGATQVKTFRIGQGENTVAIGNSNAAADSGVPSACSRRYLRLVVRDWPKTNPNGNLNNTNSGIGIGEFRLLFGGEPVAWGETALTVNPENDGGATHAEGSPKLIDGAFNTKYYPGSSTSGRYIMTFDRQAGAPAFDSYQIFAADQNGRNPTAWVLEASDDGKNWVAIDRRALDLSELVDWTWAGSTAATPGANQAKTFHLGVPESNTVTVRSGATLAGTGTITKTLVFEDGACLIKTGTDPLTSLAITELPVFSGTVRVLPPAYPLAPEIKHYILTGSGATGLDLSKFEAPSIAKLGLDDTGLFLRSRAGLMITIY